jgi:predicted amidophosphoribosyltransferase
MPDHVPRLCDRCGAPLPASRECWKCGHTRSASRAHGRRRFSEARLRRDPLVEAIEMIRPWARGERGLWARH